jgi:hypothetical protein
VSKKRIIFVAIFVVVSVLGMWGRYASEQAEKRKREALFRRLSLSPTRPEEVAPAAPTPEPPVEPRSMFDSTLPQESLELVSRAVGRDFKLMDLSFDEKQVFVKVSSDGSTVEQYSLDKSEKRVDGPQPVRLIGDGKLENSLYPVSAVDLGLVPKLSKEAMGRAALPDSHVKRVSLAYSIIRYEGEGPEWTVFVETGEGDAWKYKFVTFDTKGKFKRVS